MKQYPFIDMHIHLFNGHYLPLDGILRSWSVPGIIAHPLSIILSALVSSTDFSTPPENEPDDWVDKALELDDFGLFDVLLGRLENRLNNALLTVDVQSDEDDVVASLESLVHQHTGDIDGVFSLNTFRKSLYSVTTTEEQEEAKQDYVLVRESLFWALQEMEEHTDSPYLQAHQGEHSIPHDKLPLEQNGLLLKKRWETLRFVFTLMGSERNIYRAILKDYAAGGDHEYPLPEHMLNVMMDMDKAYRPRLLLNPPRWRFLKQIPRMVKLQEESQGRIITFAAVEPRRRNWKKYIDAAVSQGIRGFKLYPPMGIRAAKSPDYIVPVDPREFKDERPPVPRTEDVKRVRKVLQCFNEEGLRLFVHCTPTGFEAKRGYGLNSDPYYWDIAMQEEHLDDLWLCLGHGGGTRSTDWGGWACDEVTWEKTFASRVVAMCRKYENVYCDLGYLVGMFDDPVKQKRVFDHLFRELVSPTATNEYPFWQKVMYGSDWHMKSMVGRTREYLNLFYAFFDERFEDSQRDQYAEAFFSGNAKRYLGLT